MDKLGLNLGYLFVQIGSFIILFVILRAWVYRPVLSLLEKRRMAIAQGLEDARVAAEARANAEKDAKTILAEAQTQAAEKIREATERAEAAARDVMSGAEASAEKIRQDAAEEAQHERDRVLADVRNQVVALSMAAAQKLVGESLNEQRQRALIQEFFSGVKSGRVAVLGESGFAGESASAEVTSALPLTVDEKETVRQDVLSRIGNQATVTFRVDPNTLGGLVIRVGDKILDGSVAGQMENLRQSLR